MRVTVHLLRKHGCLLRGKQPTTPGHVGELCILEERDQSLGRSVVKARLLDKDKGTHTDVLPELIDARILWMEGSQLRLAGFEQIEQAAYAQTWTVEAA